VGRAFLKQLTALSTRLAGLYTHPTTISLLLISRSSKILMGTHDIPIQSKDWLAELDASQTPVPPIKETIGYLITLDKSPIILVDNTSSNEWAEYYTTLLGGGVSVVTPNKKGFSSSAGLFSQIYLAAINGTGLVSGGYVFHESTVGAGLPVLSTLRELLDTGDKVTKIEGVFSGTMGYLFNKWDPVDGSEGGAFSAAVRTARDLGYTEPDPRDDLNGLDVARKVTILARIVGLSTVSVTDFPVQSLVPKALEGCGKDEFVERLHEFDGELGSVKESAKAEGKVVRFVGSVDVTKKEVRVGLDKFDKSHPIAALKGSDNIFSIYTERYGANPLIIQGAGQVHTSDPREL
jgi:homoserine dehydrogenase